MNKKKLIALLLALGMIVSMHGCSSSEDPTPKGEQKPEQSQQVPEEDVPEDEGDQRSPEEAMEVLLWQLETGVSNKYDGFSIDHDSDSFTIQVWKESLTRSMEISSGPEDESWTMVKNNTKNTIDYLYDCIQTSELSEMNLIFHLVDHADQNKILLTFTNEEISFDILAE